MRLAKDNLVFQHFKSMVWNYIILKAKYVRKMIMYNLVFLYFISKCKTLLLKAKNFKLITQDIFVFQLVFLVINKLIWKWFDFFTI
jgi:hypothetical protein